MARRSAWGHRDQAVVGPDGGQLGQVARDLAPDPAESDDEPPLTALQQVDHLVGGRALVDADPVAHQRHLGQVGAAAVAQVLDRGPDLLQRDPGVEQPLDDLQHEDVAEAVQALPAGPVGGTDPGLDPPASPVSAGIAGPASARTSSLAKICAPVRSASAIESDGRALTSAPLEKTRSA